MVLPVTAKMMLACAHGAVEVRAKSRGWRGIMTRLSEIRELTSLDEDLHDCGCSGGFEMCCEVW